MKTKIGAVVALVVTIVVLIAVGFAFYYGSFL